MIVLRSSPSSDAGRCPLLVTAEWADVVVAILARLGCRALHEDGANALRSSPSSDAGRCRARRKASAR